ncbi:MAG: hypothetical protein AABM67_21725 [Acidobacteriota bacterium]
MFELIVMILASPFGAAILGALQDSILAVIVLSDCEECGFNDLGKLLFGGVLLAVLAGIGVSIMLRRAKEKDTNGSGFVSIRSNDPKQ